MNAPIPKKEVNVVTPVESPVLVQAPQERAPETKMPESMEIKGAPEEPVSIPESFSQELAPALPPRVSTPVPTKAKIDRLAKEIESILAEDLTDLYLAMPPDKQQEFKTKGEQTASKVRELLQAAKINAKKIFQLIRDWMKVIPGVNRFFLEQEAKIKTDKILIVAEEEQKQKTL